VGKRGKVVGENKRRRRDRGAEKEARRGEEVREGGRHASMERQVEQRERRRR